MELNRGNVIKTKEGSIQIVIDQDEKTTITIPIDSESTTFYIPNKTYTENQECYSCDGGGCDECEDKGFYVKTYYGIDKAKYLSDTIKDYFLKKLKKVTGF